MCSGQPYIKKIKMKDGNLNISWNKVQGATGYDIYVSTVSYTDNFKKVKSVGKNVTSYTISKLSNKKLKNQLKFWLQRIKKEEK